MAVTFNDYSYDSDLFRFKDWDYEKKLKNQLKTFVNSGDISKSVEIDGDQRDTYTDFAYEPFNLDSRHGFPTNFPLSDSNFTVLDKAQDSLIGRFRLGEQYTPTFFTADVAIKSLRRLLEQDKPFFLTVSFHHPHPPMLAPTEYLDYYWDRRDELLVPPSITDKMENSAYKLNLNKYLLEHNYNNSEFVQEWTAAYYALIEEIDFHVGQLLEVVEEAGAEDNTLVVFTSDHGEMLGAHALRSKNTFLEESAHGPLFISFPGEIRPETVVEDPVSHLDIVATLLDYVGAKESDNSDGSSLRKLIKGRRDNGRYEERFAVVEWDFRFPRSETGELDRDIDHRPNFMVRKGPYKLMIHKLENSRRLDMLYDLSTDPHEVKNLIGKNGNTASDEVIGKAEHLKALLVEWMDRMDGDLNYYSDPVNNDNTTSDISEIKRRRKWRKLDLWVSDTAIDFETPVLKDGAYVMNEYLYIGRTTEGTLSTADISIHGSSSSLFSVDVTTADINSGDHLRVKISFSTEMLAPETIDASLIISHGDDGERGVTIQLGCGGCTMPQSTSVPSVYPLPSSPTTSPSDPPRDPPKTEFPQKDSPTKSPSDPPTEESPGTNAPTIVINVTGVPPGTICFSGEVLVDVWGKGRIKMEELAVGDSVLVAPGKFERVFSMGHRDENAQGSFLQFLPSLLELSEDHMVFVRGKGPLPAHMVSIGDEFAIGGRVEEIRKVTRIGAYAPFTPSGALMVNGVLSSNYIAFQSSEVLKIGAVRTPFSFHWLGHSLQLPHRIWCYWLGHRDRLLENNLSNWVDLPFRSTCWLFNQPPLMVLLVAMPLICVLVAFTFVDCMLLFPALITLICVLMIGYLLHRHHATSFGYQKAVNY